VVDPQAHALASQMWVRAIREDGRRLSGTREMALARG
jgi:hypothetical protein